MARSTHKRPLSLLDLVGESLSSTAHANAAHQRVSVSNSVASSSYPTPDQPSPAFLANVVKAVKEALTADLGYSSTVRPL